MKLSLLSSFLVILAAAAFQCAAQQTVFNVPTADVLDKGKVYIELDAAFKIFGDRDVRRFSSFVPRVVVGAGGNVEIGLNLAGNINPGADSTTLVPTVKWRFYHEEKRRLTFFGGANFYVPIRNRAYKKGALVYLAAAKSLGKTRLTAGGFTSSRNVLAPHAARGGGQFAVEHAINEKVTIAADWYSGRHSNGYLTPGIVWKPRHDVTAYLSYSLGNQSLRGGNHFFLFELGYNF